MKSIIEKLRILNDIDVQLQAIDKDLERLPKELAEKEEEVQTLTDAIAKRRREIKQMKLDAEALELELKAGDAALKKFSEQINMLRTSKELEAVKRQINTQKMFNSKTEKRALELLEQADAGEKEANASDEQLKELQTALDEERQRVEKDLGELNSEKEQLGSQRKQLAQEIPDKELGIYDRIVVNRGQAIARVDRGVCSACYIQLPPQVHNLAILGKELVTCSSCGRILTATLPEN